MASATLPRRLSRAAARLLTLSRAAAAAADRDEERACWFGGQEGLGVIRGHEALGRGGGGVAEEGRRWWWWRRRWERDARESR